jgi:hypothetical protein
METKVDPATTNMQVLMAGRDRHRSRALLKHPGGGGGACKEKIKG